MKIALWIWAFFVLAGCGSPRRGPPITPPLRTADPVIDTGRQVFDRNCYPCHPGGAGGLGPALNNKPLPAFAIHTQVRHGLGAMPAFSEKQITPGQLDALIAYMKALRRQR
jgi:mono/diheme cytochrome c family protein